MPTRSRRLCSAALFVSLAGVGCAGAGVAVPPGPVPAASRLASMGARIDSIIDAPPLHRTSWGILVVDAETGRRLYERNAERHFVPASNMKLVVGAAALGRLGPDHRYRTELRLAPAAPAAPLSAQDGTGSGRAEMLLVVGSGDPTWSTRFYDVVTQPFDSLAARVAAVGVREVGTLAVDVSRFRDAVVNPTWEVADLPGIYAPPVDAFAAADGTFRLVLTGGPEPGAAGVAAPLPPFRQPLVAVVATDVEGGRTTYTTDYTARRDTLYLSARVAVGTTDTVTLAVTQPAATAAGMLTDALLRRGIAVEGLRIVRDSAEAASLRETTTAVGAFESHPMDRIVATILRPSQNWIAEQVAKTLGAEFAGDGSWRGGNTVMRAWLAEAAGIDTLDVNLRDASGMSAQNLLTPAAAVAILDHARGQPWAAAFRDGLPQPGVSGTTLSSRLAGLEGRVFAKTGTIANVNSLSGYFVAADGREYLFSILSNGSGLPAAMVRAAIDEVVRTMAAHLDP